MSEQPKPLYALCEEWRERRASLTEFWKAEEYVAFERCADELESWAKAWDVALYVPEELWWEHAKALEMPQNIDSDWISKRILGLPKGTGE